MLMVNSRWVGVGSKRLLPASGILVFFFFFNSQSLHSVVFFNFEVMLMQLMSNSYLCRSHYQMYYNMIKTRVFTKWSRHEIL